MSWPVFDLLYKLPGRTKAHLEAELNAAGMLDTVQGPNERKLQSRSETNKALLSTRFTFLSLPPPRQVVGSKCLLESLQTEIWYAERYGGPVKAGNRFERAPSAIQPSSFFFDQEIVSFWCSITCDYLWAMVRDGDREMEIFKVCGRLDAGTRLAS